MAVSPDNPLALLEAIHRFDPDDERWLARIADCAAPALGYGLGAIACGVRADADGRCALDPVRASGVPRQLLPSWAAATAATHVRGSGGVAVGDEDRRALLIPTPPATTLRRIAPRARPGTLLASALRGGRDALAIRGTAQDGRSGLLLLTPKRSVVRLSGQRQRMLDRLGAQLAAAYRLRATLSGRDPFKLAATLLPPCGRASGPGAQGIDPGGGDCIGRRGTPEAAADLWWALLAGRWCALDHRDRDGRRLLLAVATPSAGAAPFELGAHEREVLLRAAARQPLKRVACDLDLGASTVSALLRSALRKLRLDSASEAIRIASAGSLARSPD
jgi:DNA-binding CsgD family transcriptional regulator